MDMSSSFRGTGLGSGGIAGGSPASMNKVAPDGKNALDETSQSPFPKDLRALRRPALRTLTPRPPLPPPPFPPHRERGRKRGWRRVVAAVLRGRRFPFRVPTDGGYERASVVAVLPPLPVRAGGRGRERRAGEVRGAGGRTP